MVYEREITGRCDEFSRSLLDDDIPEMSQQPLKTNTICSPTKKEGVTQKLGRWGDWLLRYVPEPVKRPINNAFKKKVMILFPKQLKFEESKRSALKGFPEEHTIKATNQTFDPKTFLLAVKQKALEKFQSQTKVRLVLKARIEKVSLTDRSSIVEVRNFQSKTTIVLESTNLDELRTEIVEQILENIAVFQMNGSGWTFHSIVSLNIHTVKYKPLRGGTYITLPKFLASKKALINMKFKSEKRRNEDVQWFKLCIARALNPIKDYPERIARQLEKQAETLNFDGIRFPMKLKDIKKFEKI